MICFSYSVSPLNLSSSSSRSGFKEPVSAYDLSPSLMSPLFLSIKNAKSGSVAELYKVYSKPFSTSEGSRLTCNFFSCKTELTSSLCHSSFMACFCSAMRSRTENIFSILSFRYCKVAWPKSSPTSRGSRPRILSM